MGMSGRQLLRGVEAPMALPLVWPGSALPRSRWSRPPRWRRTRDGVASGRFIIDGLSTQDNVQVFAGALLVAVLAIVFELGLAGCSTSRCRAAFV